MTSPSIAVSNVDIHGDSAQSAIGVTVSGDLIQTMINYVRRQPPMYLSSTEVSDRVACYVPARNHSLIVSELRLSRVVGLVGPPGSGRETTAIAAMHELRPDIQIRRFSLEDEDTQEIDLAGVCGYLIRAGDRDLVGLSSCIERVRARGGYLAIVGEHDVQPTGAALLSWIQVRSPHPVQVYRHWVNKHGPVGWSDWIQAEALLEGALPADARRLADLVAKADRLNCGTAAKQAEAARAYSGWAQELCAWFSQHPSPHERALLVAAVSLPGGAEESYVYAAASSLAHRLHIEINGGGLAWCPVTGLRDLLQSGHGGKQIVFSRIGYAESALRHAVADYPLARRDLLEWLAELPTGEAAVYGKERVVAQTFADLAAEHGQDDCITKAARSWAQTDLADLAFIALSRTCLHPRVGSRVRRALYDWSRAPGTSQTLRLTIARVCEPLGQTYPSVALTRLKHLATHSDSKVAGEVLAAARNLAEQDHRQEVLAAALRWCAENSQENLTEQQLRRRRKVGAMLFLELAKPVAPSGLPQILDKGCAVDPASCLPGWRTILSFRSTPGLWDGAVERVLDRWLDAALRQAGVRARIIAVLIAAASPCAPFGRLSRISSTKPGTSTAEFMIGVVQRWAARDQNDIARTKINDEIVIPLTYPWWRRLARTIHARFRIRTIVSRPR